MMDRSLSCLLAQRFFNVRNSSGEIVNLQLNLLKLNLNKT